MKAKDTVMNKQEVIEFICGDCTLESQISDDDCRQCQKQMERASHVQAEISFKAGIREVVEWIGKLEPHTKWDCIVRITYESEWQTKLKEWGL